MPLKSGVYILECIPKKEKLGEGAMLKGLLEIALPKGYVDLTYIQTIYDFFDELKENKSKIVHISCHGNKDSDKNFYISLPNGDIVLADFEEHDRLKGRGVIITGCLLGRAGFANEFLERTKASSLIAPMNIIESFDVAIWCAMFYHHLFAKSYNFRDSYDYMRNNFFIQGAMQLWPRNE